MKYLVTLLVFVVCSMNAQTFSDDFTGLTTSSNLAGQSSWTKGGSGPDATVANTTPLTYAGYSSSGGEYVVLPTGTATSSRVYKGFSSTITTFSTHTIIYSMLVRINTALGASSNYFFTLGNSGAGTVYFARLFAIPSGGGFKFGLSKLSNTPSLEATERSFGTTYLVVVRYTFKNGSTSDDEAFLWVNPAGSSEPSTGSANISILTAAASSDMNGADIGNVLWHNRSANNPTGAIDAIRVGFGPTSSDAWLDLNPGALPVEVSSFRAVMKGTNVELAWQTATEKNNRGFDVEKNVNGAWSKIGFVAGAGNSNAPKSYSYTDASAKGASEYRLKQIDNDGAFTYSAVVNASAPLTAADYQLGQNYPNPFNPTTMIRFAMAAQEHVSLTVYNALGQEVASLFNGVAQPNQMYELPFNGSNLASGTYFYALRSASRNEVRKMLLSK